MSTTFLDRDGTINRKAPEGEHVTSWADFEFLPGAVSAIADLTSAGQRIVIVTNQRCIALGRLSEDRLREIHCRMSRVLEAAGGRVSEIYHCPHLEGSCDCRKPRPGMLIRAQSELPGLLLDKSLLIGDAPTDMEAARRAGAHRVFIGGSADVAADLHAESLADAAAKLLQR